MTVVCCAPGEEDDPLGPMALGELENVLQGFAHRSKGEIMETISVTRKYTWPREITRGPLKGRVFPSKSAYDRAIMQVSKHAATSGLKGDTVVRIVDSYEEMVAAGLGRRQAVAILQRVFGA